jgi:mannosyltransferase
MTFDDASTRLAPDDRVAVPGAATADGGRAGARRRAAPPWLPVAVAVLAGLVSGGYRLGTPSLWRDEAATVDAAQRSVAQIFALLGHMDAVNGAYYLVVHPVIVIWGSSPTAIRAPSVLAMALAAGFTAALGRRLAAAAGLPSPAFTGLLAGLLLVAAPQATRYAQEARAYGIVALLATLASYLLVRALADDRWRWWAGYGAALACAGLFNLFCLLLIVAHGLSLLALRAGPAATRPPGRQLRRWAGAAGAATAVLMPLLVAGYRQRGQVAWLTRPGWGVVSAVVQGFAGSRAAVVPVALLALAGAVAGLAPRRAAALTPGVIAVPWVAAPPVILLTISQAHPLFTWRYVEFSQPALALLCAAGLSWLAGLAARLPRPRLAHRLAWLPPVAIMVLLGVLLAGPQQAVRRPDARLDNLRWASTVLARHELPGDAVFYLPSSRRILSMAYPGPWRRLRDVALARSPGAAATLAGIEVSPAVLRQRFAGVPRVWLVTIRGLAQPPPDSRTDHAKIAMIRQLHLVGRWRAGAVVLRLYARSWPPRSARQISGLVAGGSASARGLASGETLYYRSSN